MVRCKHCGVFLEKEDKRRRYCSTCAPIVEHEKNLIRNQHFRDAHREELRLYHRKWREAHPEERRLHARNYIHRHKELHRQRLYQWRERNPDLVKEQNIRAKKQLKVRKMRRLNSVGIRKEVKAVTSSVVSICKACGREIPHGGVGRPRILCDGCFPQINALKRVLRQEKYKREHPGFWHIWNQDTSEVVVAMTCRVCGNFILYKGKGKYPQKCGLCKCIERSKPRPIWNPKDTKVFIEVERRRLGLGKNKRWSKHDIFLLEEERNWGAVPVAVSEE